MLILPSRFASPPYVNITKVSVPLTVRPDHVVVWVSPRPRTSPALTVPRVVKSAGCAELLTMPLPCQLPPLRPAATSPATPLYADPVHDPVGWCTTSLLVVMSSLAPAA